MAGPSMTQGSVGTMQVDPQNTGAGALQHLAQTLVGIKDARQKQATDQLERMMKAAEAGFPIDPKAIEKTAKRAGLPIASHEDMKGMIDPKLNGSDKGGGGSTPGGGTTGGGSPQSNPNAAVVQGKQGVHARREAALNAWIGQALALSRARGDNALKQEQLKGQMLDLKAQAAQGDKEAVGKLMAAGEIPFNINQVQWQGATDEQRRAMIDMAAGHESDAEFKKRATGISESLIASGKITDPSQAFKAGEILAKGGQLTGDTAAAVNKYTFSELADQAKLANELVQLGVPPDKIAGVTRAAAAGGIQNALPTALNPIVLQELNAQKAHYKAMEAAEQSKLTLEQRRLLLEVRNAQTTAKKLDLAEQREDAKESVEFFKSLVDIRKAGGKIPDAVMKQAINNLADKAGLDVSETKSFWDYLTGGTSYEFTPRADKAAAGAAAGGKQAEPPSTMSKIGSVVGKIAKGVRQATQEPQ